MNTQNNKPSSQRKTSQSRAKTPRRTSRPAAKKPTTIDLQAQDMTPQEQKKAQATASPAKQTQSTGSKPDPTPANTNPSTASKTAKTDTNKPSEFGRNAKTPSQKTPSGKASKPAEKPKSSAGFGKLVAAGIVGGLVTLGGAAGMQFAGMLPNLSQAPSGESASSNVDIKPVEAQIAKLQERLDNLPVPSGAASPDLTPLEQRLTALENAPKAQADSQTELDNEQLTQLTKKIAALEVALADSKSASGSPDNAVMESLSKRLSQVENSTTPLQESIEKIGTFQQTTSQQINTLTQKMNDFSNSLSSSVEERIGEFEEKLKTAATGEKLAKSVAINALKSSMERGEPFSAALTSLETLQGQSELIDSLKVHAATGLPTAKMLRSEFHEVERNIIAAASDTQDAGVVDRLMNSVSSLVTVRSDTPEPGDTPKAIVSRIDASLKTGELAAAMNEWNALPQAAKEVSSDWINRLKSRIEADQIASELLQSVQAAG